MEQSNGISFKGQNIYVGIDVHLKRWSVTILSETSVLKRMSQGADPDALHRYLTSHYPEAEYYSVYEAGFCGFWIHDRLTELGVHNIVVNPADVPTMSSEKLRKTDAVDSRKLAVSLRAKQLRGIYTPDSEALEIRSLIRLKNSITKDMTRKLSALSHTERFEETLKLLMTVSGIGQTTGLALMAEIVDVTRFSNAEQLAASACGDRCGKFVYRRILHRVLKSDLARGREDAHTCANLKKNIFSRKALIINYLNV